MSSNSSDRRPLSLAQLGRGGDPLLIPVAPGSSIEEIARLVRESGAPRVELLVPDATDALRSVDGARALREAALDSGVRLTIFTADDRIADAAHAANLDVFGVGAKVAAPRRGAHPADPPPAAGTERLPAQPPLPASEAGMRFELPPSEATSAADDRSPERTDEPAFPEEAATPEQVPEYLETPAAAMPGAAADKTDFLSRLDAFDHTAAAPEPAGVDASPEQPRLGRSNEGALLFDAPGDLGVPRPGGDYLLPAVDTTAEDEASAEDEVSSKAEAPRRPFVATVDEQAQPLPDGGSRPRPSLLAALFGFLPSRATVAAAPAGSTRPSSRPVPKQALRARMAETYPAPARTAPQPKDGPRAAGRNPVWLLVPLLLLGGIGLLWFADIDWRSAAGNVLPGIAPSLVIEPPTRSTEAEQITDAFVPLANEPPADPGSTSVHGIVLAAPVTVTLEGTAATTALTPFGTASGTLLFSNPSSQPITIPAGTPVQADGSEFTFDESVTIAGAVSDFAGTRNGQGSARLTARLAGAQGNIAAGTITNVPGYTGGAGPLRVLQEQPFAGGSDAEVIIVTPDDVSRLLPEALTRLYAKGVRDIDAALAGSPGFELVQTEATAPISPTQQMLADVQPGDFEVFPAIGQVVSPELNGVFKLQMTQQFEALASPVDQPIDEQLRRAVANLRNGEGGKVAPEEVQITGWRRGEGGLRVDAVVTPRAGYQTVPPERAEEIAASLRGRSLDQAREQLDRLKAEGLIGSYRLPDDWQTVPEGVVVTIAPPKAPSRQQ